MAGAAKGRLIMWPTIDFGHTGIDAAFTRRDVYDVAGKPELAAKRPLRVAIAGCGGVAQAKWIPALRRLQTIGEPVSFCGVADPDGAAAEKAALLAGTHAFPDIAQLIRVERPDLVLVLATDSVHVSLARQAIDAGIACLVEKPLARESDEAAALARHAESRGVLLGAVANKRFSPPYALAKALMDEGRLKGAPTLFTGKFTLGYPYVDLLEGGTVHLLDLMRWYMGSVRRVHARGLHHTDGRLKSAVMSFGFASGAIGTIMTSAAGLSFKPWERVEIFGDGVFLVIDDQFETTLFDDETGPAKSWRPAVPNTLMFDETFGGYVGLLANLLDSVRGLAPLAATGKDGVTAIRLIEAIYRSLACGAEITMTEEEFAA